MTDKFDLEATRATILSVLTREATQETDPWLWEEDGLYFQTLTLEAKDTEWLISQLLDSRYDYEARFEVLANTRAAARRGALPTLREERPDYVGWKLVKS